MTCTICHQPLGDVDPHYPHEPGCDRNDCDCHTPVHPWCCPDCKETPT